MARMRVLHILNELKPSGAELMLHAAAPLWKNEGIDGDILCTGERTGSLAATLEKDGFRIHHLPFSPTIGYVRRVFRLMQNSKFDMVHIHTERANFWYGLAARAARIPRVFRTVHNVFPFKGGLRARRYLQRAILRNLGVRNISISGSVKRTELEHYSNPTELIPNWFEDHKYVPATEDQRRTSRDLLGISAEKFVLISVGGCWTYKNHPAIIRSLTKVPDRQGVLYLHVGMECQGRPEFRLAQELGVGESVRFMGIVPDILPYLHAADAFVMPSLWEGFGCAAIEAMGCGLPTVLSNVEGLSDFKQTCAGICWVDCEPESIATAIGKMRGMSIEERLAIGRGLAESAHRHFGTARGAARYAELYLGGNRRQCHSA
jgi:glycosyltransferase involved in cell wall biosynthesis